MRIAPKRLKLRTSNLTRDSPDTTPIIFSWPGHVTLKFKFKLRFSKNSLGDMHSHERFLANLIFCRVSERELEAVLGEVHAVVRQVDLLSPNSPPPLSHHHRHCFFLSTTPAVSSRYSICTVYTRQQRCCTVDLLER